MAKIKITQTGSPIRRPKDQRATLIGLGPQQDEPHGRIEDTPDNMGAIRKVAHMLKVRSKRTVLGERPGSRLL
jgi:large subunit ribosomal protein L30